MDTKLLLALLTTTLFTTVHGAEPAVASTTPAPKPIIFSDERKLYHALIDTLVRSLRPVKQSKDTVNLGLGMVLLRLDDLDEKYQKLRSNVWLQMSWNDPQLVWDPAEHNDIQTIRLPCNAVWLPDIVLYNGAHGSQDVIPCYDWMQVVVSSDGKVLYIPHYQMESTCQLDMSKFPYDTQTCVLKFGSWVFHQGMVNISHYLTAEIDTSSYSEHGVWDLVGHSAVLTGTKYACCTETYQDITYTMTLKRKSNYYTNIFVAPAVILCFITPTIFWLPSDGSEKMSLGTGVLLGHIFLLTMLEIYIPSAHPVVPLIGVYYIFGLVMVALAIVLAVMVKNIWSQSNRRRTMPRILRTVVLGLLGRLLCVRREPYMPVQELQDMEGETNDRATASKVASVNARSEWRQLAVILDRLFFIVFFVIVIVVSGALLG